MNRDKEEVRGADIVGSPKSNASGPGPEVMAASTLEGNDVYNSQGEKLGSRKDSGWTFDQPVTSC